MLRKITWAEFTEWLIFSQLEPFDEERADVRAAAIRSTIANVNRKKGSKVFTVADFMTHFGDSVPERKVQTWQEQKAIGQLMAKTLGSKQQRPQPRRRPDGRR